MEKKAISIIAILLIIGIGFVIGVWYLQTPAKKFTGQPESITLGVTPYQSSTLIWIADNQHFFAENGLNVTIKEYESGMNAVNALLAGDVDIATAAEFVTVRNVLAGKNITAIGCIAKTDDVFIVGRKDRGIANSISLKGKKIGFTKGTVSEFFLGRYLALHGIDPQSITLVDLKLPQLVDGLAKGDLDAAIMWEPYVFYAENQLGTNAVILPGQSGQSYYWMLLTKDDFLKTHPTAINRFIHSMAEAHDFVIAHPAESKKIVQQKLNYDAAYMEKIWPENEFALSLDQSLIVAMDDEARWLIKNNLTDKRQVPVFLDYISRNTLDAVRPSAVNIIR